MLRRRSLCTRIKKERSCKRFRGCKYAKGTKRQYCRIKHRTRKNKKV